jgi:hypothetical protein
VQGWNWSSAPTTTDAETASQSKGAVNGRASSQGPATVGHKPAVAGVNHRSESEGVIAGGSASAAAANSGCGADGLSQDFEHTTPRLALKTKHALAQGTFLPCAHSVFRISCLICKHVRHMCMLKLLHVLACVRCTAVLVPG